MIDAEMKMATLQKNYDLKFDFNINEEYQYVGGIIVTDDSELSLFKLQS